MGSPADTDGIFHNLGKGKFSKGEIIIIFHKLSEISFKGSSIDLFSKDPDLQVDIDYAVNILIKEGYEPIGDILHHLLTEAAHHAKIMETEPAIIQHKDIPGVGVRVEKAVFKYLF